MKKNLLAKPATDPLARLATGSAGPRKLVLANHQCPGDVLMLTAAVRDLHLTYPGKFLTNVTTSCPALWENNPYVTPNLSGPVLRCDCPLIHQSNRSPYHFIHAFRMFLNDKLGLNILPGGGKSPERTFGGDIHLSDEEKGWLSQVDEITGMSGTRFWIVVAGGKSDYSAKIWDPARYQQVVDYFGDGKNRIRFVQCGARDAGHTHTPLRGVIDLVGKTDLRQMVRLMYHADGVISPVTFAMHLAAAVPTKPGRPMNRPAVVIAGAREPAQWEAYPHHRYISNNGCLPCADDGGCWRSRVLPLGDGDEQDKSLCEKPVKLGSGVTIPKCLHMITAADVIKHVEDYLEFDR